MERFDLEEKRSSLWLGKNNNNKKRSAVYVGRVMTCFLADETKHIYAGEIVNKQKKERKKNKMKGRNRETS